MKLLNGYNAFSSREESKPHFRNHEKSFFVLFVFECSLTEGLVYLRQSVYPSVSQSVRTQFFLVTIHVFS